MNVKGFQRLVWEHYDQQGRDMPWRVAEPDGSFDPYKIWISEMMLQQTQVDRVIPKYEAFVSAFPNMEMLARASFQQVLEFWQGLGYNRRAKYLHDTAKALVGKPFPRTIEELVLYNGIGHNTAAAILVYSFNQPEVYVETNIRTIYLYHFFLGQTDVNDKELLEKVAATLDKSNPRSWYLALMDYGAYLKKSGIKNIANSKHYTKQSRFKGSDREIRGKIMKLLVDSRGSADRKQIQRFIGDDRVEMILDRLKEEGLVLFKGQQVRLP